MRKHLDTYPTNDMLARQLVQQLDVSPRLVLEPAADGGAFIRACKWRWPDAHVKGVDVAWYDKGMADEYVQADFLAHDWPEVDLIITNPPFKVAEQFVHHALRFAPTVAMLLRLGFLAGQGRYRRLWTKNKPSSVVVLPKRPSFTGDGKTDNSEYAFFIFDKTSTCPPSVKWMEC